MRRVLLVLPFLLAVGACGSDEDSGVTTDPPATTPSTPEGTEPTSPPTPGSLTTSTAGIVVDGPDVSLVAPAPGAPGGGTAEQQAINDLVARQGVDPAAITIVSVDEVTWRDGSIGCPEEGMLYTQALVDGVRVVLELDGTRYEYHSGGSRDLFLCETPEPPVGE